jgi:type IV secretion system protein VirD4
MARSGVVLGKWGWTTLRYDGQVHTLMVAPTGSGKSTSLCIPTALSWQHSLFVTDPKQEVYTLSAGWRRLFSTVIHLNPTAADSDCFNPLSAIRLETEYEIRDTMLLTDILVDPEGERAHSATAQHFRDLTNVFLQGIVLHGLYTGTATTLTELDQFFFSESSMAAVLKEMESTSHTLDGVHPAVQRSVHLLRRLADRELSGVLSTVSRALQMTMDPLVARMTSSNDFRLQDLRERHRPLSLYLTVPYSDQERLRPLSRLITRQVLDYTTHRLGGWRHRMLLLIDECQALGYMPALAQALNFVRGFGMQLVLITPSLNDLDRLYGEKNNFVEGAHLRVVFAPNDAGIAEKFSRMTGMHEQVEGQTTYEQRLLSQTGLTYLPKDKGLLLIGNGGYPALITKAPYYQSRRLRRRAAC